MSILIIIDKLDSSYINKGLVEKSLIQLLEEDPLLKFLKNIFTKYKYKLVFNTNAEYINEDYLKFHLTEFGNLACNFDIEEFINKDVIDSTVNHRNHYPNIFNITDQKHSLNENFLLYLNYVVYGNVKLDKIEYYLSKSYIYNRDKLKDTIDKIGKDISRESILNLLY